MRKVLFTGILCLALSSCSDAVMTERLGQTSISGPSFSFDSITSPANWIQYQSLEKMLDACQIPEEVLKTMPTDEMSVRYYNKFNEFMGSFSYEPLVTL